MAKIRTKQPVAWGGFNPLILNNIEIEMTEVSKDSSGCKFEIKDVVLFPFTQDEIIINQNGKEFIESIAYERPEIVIRCKQISISTERYNELHNAVDVYLNTCFPEITELEKELKKSAVGLFLYFTTDLLPNGKCGYNTNPIDWEIVW